MHLFHVLVMALMALCGMISAMPSLWIILSSGTKSLFKLSVVSLSYSTMPCHGG